MYKNINKRKCICTSFLLYFDLLYIQKIMHFFAEANNITRKGTERDL